MMKKPVVLSLILGLALFAFWFTGIEAYESYHDPNLNDQGYCSTCHPGFTKGQNDETHSLHTKGSDPVTETCTLCHTSSQRENPLTMWSEADGLGCAGCHGRDYGETTGADYRGFPTAGKAKASGYGLRKHHLNSGVTVCLDCHADVLPSSILPESTNPPYYALVADVSLGGLPVDSCTNEDTANDADVLGLDNDGDLFYDGGDFDCLATVPQINLVPASVDFGTVFIGGSADLFTEVQNIGTADLDVTLVDLCAGTSPEFSWSPDLNVIIPPGGTETLMVTYAPVDEGSDTGCLQITSNDLAQNPAFLDLAGIGALVPEPDINLVPNSVDFLSVLVGDTMMLSTEVQNVGTANLDVTVIDRCAGTTLEYTWAPAASFTVAPGSSQTLMVTFAPVDEGLETGCLEISSNDPDELLVTLDLTGTGTVVPEPDINLVPNFLDFGTLFIGDSLSLPTDVQNLGTGDLTVTLINHCAGTSAEFSWLPGSPFTLTPGASLTLTVTYTPVDVGADGGCLEIASDDPDEPLVTLDLSGIGEEPPVIEPDINLLPAALDLGTVFLGEAGSLPTEVENLGTAPLDVTLINLCAGTSTEFTWLPPSPFTVADGSSQTLTVIYTPTDAGTDTGCLEIASNDPDEPLVTLDLTATGDDRPLDPDINLVPTSVDLGTVLVGSSGTQTSEIQNVGLGQLGVSLILHCPGTSSEFSWTPGTPILVDPLGGEILTIIYTPVNAGTDTGCLELYSNDPDESPVLLDLTGVGEEPVAANPDINLVPGSVDFGAVPVGDSTILTFDIQNLGTDPLEVSSILRCSGTTAEFGWTPGAPITVAPGASRTLTLFYGPVDVGADSGCLEIISNDPDEGAVLLLLTGSGSAGDPPVQDPDINLVPTSLDFGPVSQGGTTSLTVDIQNLGPDPLDVSLILHCPGTSSEFSWAPGTPITVAPLGSETLTVSYTPVNAGNDTGCLELYSNDPDENPVTLALTGSGTGEDPPAQNPDIDLVPAALDLGTVLLGDSANLVVEIHNLGADPLEVTGIGWCPGTSSEFSWAPGAPITVAPSGAETLTVSYTPLQAGTDTGCLQIASNDPDEGTVTLNLLGTGEAPVLSNPDINLVPGALDFGTLAPGEAVNLPVQIQNLGPDPLDISLIIRCSGTSSEFLWNPGSPQIVAPFGTLDMTVFYIPVNAGTDTGCLEFHSNDPDENPIRLDLSGTRSDEAPAGDPPEAPARGPRDGPGVKPRD